jgi:hypothetical protein
MIDFSLMVNEIAPKHFLPALVVFTASEMTRVGLVLPAAQPPTSDASNSSSRARASAFRLRTSAVSLSGAAQG